MSIELILFGVVALVLVLDFVLKGIKRKKTQDDVERIGEEQSKRKRFNFNYILSRKRNFLTFILLVILTKPILHYLLFTESEKKYDYQTKVNFQLYENVYFKLDVPFPKSIANKLEEALAPYESDNLMGKLDFIDISGDTYIHSSVSFVSLREVLDAFRANALQYREQPEWYKFDIEQMKKMSKYLFSFLELYRNNKRNFLKENDSLLIDSKLGNILFPKKLFLNESKNIFKNSTFNFNFIFEQLGIKPLDEHENVNEMQSSLLKEFKNPWDPPIYLQVKDKNKLRSFSIFNSIQHYDQSERSNSINFQDIPINRIYNFLYNHIEQALFKRFIRINNIFTKNGEKILTNDIIELDNYYYTNDYYISQSILKKIKFYYHPVKYEIRSLSWHIEKLFSSKLWLIAVSFASLGVLVLLFNDKIKAR